jgi:exopolyphosphatase / guanosine-5'-triphosphate,3'-diphosphate pyrophosphatase
MRRGGWHEPEMGQPPVRVGVVDIGTNSMRLLIRDEDREYGRWVEVTGLGRGVDETKHLSEEAMDRTLAVLHKFGVQMRALEVEARSAVATSAAREALNRDQFLDQAEKALGVRPEVISGVQEGLLAFDGATSDFVVAEPVLVTDIGGGSTEFVMYDTVFSVDMGSVRLTDRMSDVYPLPDPDFEEAMGMAWDAFDGIVTDEFVTHVGVAGTWTSLAAIAQDLPKYESRKVHGSVLHEVELDRVIDMLCDMTLPEIEAIPSLDPKRAPVIRAGAIVARAVMGVLWIDETIISERDTLDGLAMGLLDVP